MTFSPDPPQTVWVLILLTVFVHHIFIQEFYTRVSVCVVHYGYHGWEIFPENGVLK